MKDWARRHPLASFLLLHTAGVALFFSPAILIRGIVLPAELLHAFYPWGAYFQTHVDHNAELPDVILQFYPWFLRWSQELRAGHLPLWNADSGLGLPFAANPQTASFFPLTFLALLGPWAWTLVLASRLVIAGAAAFLWLRSLGRSRAASTFGGLAFAYSLPFVTNLGCALANVNMLLPLLLLWAVRLARAPGPAPACGLAFTLFAMHLGGHPESAFLDLLAALLVWSLSLQKAPIERIARSGAFLAVGGVLGTLAAAIQLVPFLEYLARSRVLLEPKHAPLILAKSWLMTWIVPLFFGRSMDGTKWYAGFLDSAAFAGTSILSLAGVAIVTVRMRRTLPILAFGVLPVALAYGLPPLSLLGSVPPLDRTATHRSLPIAALAVVTLGAFGWDRLIALVRARRRQVVWRLFAVPALFAAVAVAGVLTLGRAVPDRLLRATALPETRLALLFLFGPLLLALFSVRAGALRTAAAFGLLTFDLWRVAFGYYGTVDRGLSFFPTRLTDFLRRDAGRSRVVPIGMFMPPNLNMPYDIPSVMSYDAIDSHEQAVFLRKLGGYDAKNWFSPVDPRRLANPRVAELAALKYWLDDPEYPRLDTPEFERRTGFRFSLVYDQPDGRVYELAGVPPRVRFAARAFADPGLKTFDRLLEARDERASRELFVDAMSPPARDGGPGRVVLLSRGSGTIKARVESEGGGWLALADAFDPGWTAEVGGRSTPVYRANGPLMAVPVPAGSWVVRVRYRPRSFYFGAALSALGLISLAFLGRLGRRGRSATR
jgi:Bacterial membrane protein YfhO